jgi:hypothetical protein
MFYCGATRTKAAPVRGFRERKSSRKRWAFSGTSLDSKSTISFQKSLKFI